MSIINNEIDRNELELFNKRSIADEQDEPFDDRNSSGLRNLSLKVKNIVLEKGTTTYKVVAEQLVSDLKYSTSELNMDPIELARYESNIKRRVYDALNVLISSGVIVRKGKSVQVCDKSFLQGKCLKGTHWEKAKGIDSSIQSLKVVIREKLNTMKELGSKIVAVHNLMRRNREEEERINYQIQNSSLYSTLYRNFSDRNHAYNDENIQTPKNSIFTSQEEILRSGQSLTLQFPLITVKGNFNAPNNSIVLQMERKRDRLHILGKDKLQVMGDLDILLAMGFAKVSEEFSKNVLGSEKFLQVQKATRILGSVDGLKFHSSQLQFVAPFPVSRMPYLCGVYHLDQYQNQLEFSDPLKHPLEFQELYKKSSRKHSIQKNKSIKKSRNIKNKRSSIHSDSTQANSF